MNDINRTGIPDLENERDELLRKNAQLERESAEMREALHNMQDIFPSDLYDAKKDPRDWWTDETIAKIEEARAILAKYPENPK